MRNSQKQRFHSVACQRVHLLLRRRVFHLLLLLLFGVLLRRENGDGGDTESRFFVEELKPLICDVSLWNLKNVFLLEIY